MSSELGQAANEEACLLVGTFSECPVFYPSHGHTKDETLEYEKKIQKKSPFAL